MFPPMLTWEFGSRSRFAVAEEVEKTQFRRSRLRHRRRGLRHGADGPRVLPHNFRLRRPGNVVPNPHQHGESRYHRTDIPGQSDYHDEIPRRARAAPGLQTEPLDASNRGSVQRGHRHAVPHNDLVWTSSSADRRRLLTPLPAAKRNFAARTVPKQGSE